MEFPHLVGESFRSSVPVLFLLFSEIPLFNLTSTLTASLTQRLYILPWRKFHQWGVSFLFLSPILSPSSPRGVGRTVAPCGVPSVTPLFRHDGLHGLLCHAGPHRDVSLQESHQQRWALAAVGACYQHNIYREKVARQQSVPGGQRLPGGRGQNETGDTPANVTNCKKASPTMLWL